MNAKSHRVFLAGLLGAFIVPLMLPGAALAAQSCSVWMDQGDGTSWAQCVDDNGQRHCWLINNAPGSVAREVQC